MSDSQEKLVSIEYLSLPGTGVRHALRTVDPAIRIVILLVVCLIGTWLGVLLTKSLITIPLLLPYCGFLSATLMFLLATDQIYIGQAGISFPSALGLRLKGRTTRLWSELEGIEILSNASHVADQTKAASRMRLRFRSGDSLDLKLKHFSREGINTFVGAAAEWADGCKFDQQFEQIPKLYEYETGNYKSISYTQFWEEQLANTYTFTAFVPLRIGHRLRNDTITVLSQMAAGGFSAIYLAKTNEGKKVVLKEAVTPNTLPDEAREKVRQHFKREAELLVRLNHRSIARVFDHFVEGGRHYLLLEYISGPDLRSYIRQHGPQSEAQARRWLCQLAEVLSYLHEQSPPIVHRDLTPENLIVTEGERLVVIDFGAANEFIGEATGTLVGKQAYISPEQIRGKAAPQSDIYSLGATMFFVLTGRDPEPLSSCSPRAAGCAISDGLDSLIAACTKLELAQRLSSAGEINGKLQEKLSAAPVAGRD